jgi:hypothetical protein
VRVRPTDPEQQTDRDGALDAHVSHSPFAENRREQDDAEDQDLHYGRHVGPEFVNPGVGVNQANQRKANAQLPTDAGIANCSFLPQVMAIPKLSTSEKATSV